MPIVTIKAVFKCNVQEAWDTVNSLSEYSWRSDLSKIEVVNEKQFIEYTKDGYATTFTITTIEPYKRLEFDIENGNMKGHWTGVFTEINGATQIDFTEDINAKKFYLKPFVKMYLKKQQSKYIADLHKAVGC